MGSRSSGSADGTEAPEELAARFRAGDLAAFRAIYEAHVGRVYALAVRMTACSHRAEDLTQEIFLRAWGKRRTLRDGRALGAWLTRLAVNVLVSASRRELRRRARQIEMPEEQEVADPAPPRDIDGGIDLERAIAGLPPGARAVFVLHDLEGYTHEEIGRMVGIAPGTSKAQLHRARAILREEVER